MRLFINDISVEIIRHEDVGDLSMYQVVLDAKTDSIEEARFFHHVLIKHATPEQIDQLLDLMNVKIFPNLYSISISVDDHKSAKHFVKQRFKIVQAAGGVVKKGNKILMIYRFKRWDLPKGKIEKKEKKKNAARREVEEECGIKVKVERRVTATWHTYTMNGKRMLKKTYWYAMSCLDDSKMKPQKSENIEEVRWLTPKEVYITLRGTYRSLTQVIQAYNEMMTPTD